MLLSFDYLNNLLCFLFFSSKISRLIGSVGPKDQQINLVLLNESLCYLLRFCKSPIFVKNLDMDQNALKSIRLQGF